MTNSRLSNIRQLLRFKKLTLNPKRRRLESSLTIHDLRRVAYRTTPIGPFDYVDGAAEDEVSLSRARQAFKEIEFQPYVLRDVSNVSLRKTKLGKEFAMPLGIAPIGFSRMMHTEGERAGVGAAQQFQIPFALSTMGTTSIENVAAAGPEASKWFQLYLWRDRDRSLELIKRAERAGFEGLILTVDAQVAGARLRDVRNGLTVPPSLRAKTLLNAIPRVGWWWNFLTKEPLVFASLDSWDGTVAELMNTMFDPTMTLKDLKWIRSVWNGKILVKGIQRVDDARDVAKSGVDGVWLSNHGGRQLDRAPIPFHLIEPTRRAIGRKTEIHIDTGIMHGGDVIAALAKGADFAWVGRAYMYGLMAGGRAGVNRSLEILQTQMIRTLKLLGVSDLKELNPKMVKTIIERNEMER
jgi:isopentenyl diphosphate isomerase/L-lactate dehydrogenase-like FMN-dependent dehydrogenase